MAEEEKAPKDKLQDLYAEFQGTTDPEAKARIQSQINELLITPEVRDDWANQQEMVRESAKETDESS